MDQSDSSAQQDQPPRREHFIPIRASQLLRLMYRQKGMSRQRVQTLREFYDTINGIYIQSLHHRLEDLEEDFSLFDPDNELLSATRTRPSLKSIKGERFGQQVGEILRNGNYIRITQKDMEQSLERSDHWGLKYSVDFTQFDLLDVYVRGISTKRVSRRHWSRLFRKQQADLQVFSRVVMVFRPKKGHKLGGAIDSDGIYIKAFKDIPETEINMLVPGSKTVFNIIDQGKIFLPAISGIFAGIKIAKTIAIWLPRLFWLFRILALTSVIKWITGWSFGEGGGLNLTGWIIAGLLAVSLFAFRSILSYSRQSKDYQSQLTNNLYYRSLGTNGSVLIRILEEAKEQEVREILLGYFVIWYFSPEKGWNTAQVDAAVEAFLKNWLGMSVDFEVEDSIRKLVGWGLISKTRNQTWKAEPPELATARLKQRISEGVHYSILPNCHNIVLD